MMDDPGYAGFFFPVTGTTAAFWVRSRLPDGEIPLGGLLVKVSASRVGDPGLIPTLAVVVGGGWSEGGGGLRVESYR